MSKRKRLGVKESAHLESELAKAKAKAEKWDQLCALLADALQREMTAIAEDAVNSTVDDLQISRHAYPGNSG